MMAEGGNRGGGMQHHAAIFDLARGRRGGFGLDQGNPGLVCQMGGDIGKVIRGENINLRRALAHGCGLNDRPVPQVRCQIRGGEIVQKIQL